MNPRQILATHHASTTEFNSNSYTHIRAIIELHRGYLHEEFDRIGEYAPGLPVAAHLNTLLIRCGNQIAGFCAIDPHNYALELVYLAPEHRGKGIVSAVITQMKATCPQRMGAKMPFTPSSQALVQRTGLRPITPSPESLLANARQLADINRTIRKECPHKGGNPAKACPRCYRKALSRSAEYVVQSYLTEQRETARQGAST
ncbi:GNAT family N-acetyltransferase [Streptomyces cyaneofuscatus]|uniref:GNAT family N-acetyltransferase n=1 Tax=Streptomyces cyaneofuscatus TaxID=66883 RepID=UPI0033D35B5F